MLKRLPILCAALLALAACSQDSDNSRNAGTAPTPAPAPTVSTASAAPAPVPAASSPATSEAATAGSTPPAASAPPPPSQPFVDDGKWVEGKDYDRIEPAQPKVTSTDKVEVVEVFSYGCPACNQYHATANKLARELPAEATMVYLPASFIPQENWPMLQRAYYTAQALGVAGQGNDAMYDAVWKSHELSAMNAAGTGLKPKSALPTIADAAKVYARFGADPKEFVAVSKSFSVDTKTRRADELIKNYGVEGTPTIVIDGKYRISPSKVGYEESVDLTKWLVAREAAGQ